MSLFTRDATAKLAAADFHSTKTIFEAPRFSFLPSFYQDEKNKKWAVVLKGMPAAIHSYADIVDCQVIENEAFDSKGADQKALFKKILMNPALVSKANASKNGKYCTSMHVVLQVLAANGEVSTLGVPLVQKEVRRDSSAYEMIKQVAKKMRDDFLAMKEAGQA